MEMKSKYILFGMLAMIGGFVSCSKADVNTTASDPDMQQISFTATWIDERETKTSVQSDGTSIWWNAAEEINLFSGSVSARLISDNTKPAPTAVFCGYIPVTTGSDAGFYASYPYSKTTTFDGDHFVMTVPSEQTASAGTFADKLFPAIARSNGSSLSFYNVCGGVVFTVVTPGIRTVTFQGLGGESLVGTVSVAFGTDGLPRIDNISDGSSVVVLTPPDGESFEVGQKYYAVLLPQVLEKGLSIKLQTDDQEARYQMTGSVQVNRSRFGRLTNLDAQLQWGELSTIPFKDAQLKAVLVARFDTDGDGELSPAETAAVTSLEGVFPQARVWQPAPYTSFDEFRWFTSVDTVPESCFAWWTGLKSIRLPESITCIQSDAFVSCSSLTGIQLPNQLSSIYFGAFDACTGLTSVELPESLTYIMAPFPNCDNLTEFRGKGATDDHRGLVFDIYGNSTFVAIAPSGLTEYDIPDGVSVVQPWVFTGCSKLTRVGIPASVKRLERAVFHGCSSLSSISIPEGVEFLGDYLFRDCSSLQSLTIPETVTHVGDIRLGIWDPVTSCSKLEAFYGKFASPDHRSLIVDDTYIAVALASGSASLEIPAGVTTIGESAFNKAKLDGISIPDGVTRIEINAFCDAHIPVITVPASVTSLGSQAFASVRGNVYFLSENPPVSEGNLFGDTTWCSIYVPAASLEAYRTAEGWSNYASRIQAIAD